MEKYPMRFCPEESENSVLALPLKKDAAGGKVIDWDFIREINKHKDMKVPKRRQIK